MCKYFAIFMNASISVKDETLKPKFDLHKLFLNILKYFKQQLFQLKVGNDKYPENFYKEKLYKLSICSSYNYHCQPYDLPF